MVDDNEACIGVRHNLIDYRLTVGARFYQLCGPDMKQMRAIPRDLVARYQYHSLTVPLTIIRRRCEQVMVGKSEEIVAVGGVIIEDRLHITRPIAARRVRVQVS